MIRMRVVWTLFGSVAMTPAAWAASPAPSSKDQKPELIVEKALASEIHQNNQVEMEMGRLARTKGQQASVRAFGERLYRDHRFADSQIMDYAKDRGLDLPTPEPVTVEEQAQAAQQQAMLEKLRTLQGPEFDRAFLDAMTMGHDQAIERIQATRAALEDRRLERLAAKLVPILREHRELAVRVAEHAGR
jgi:putative membrane protein